MTWQDILITIATIAISYALIPQVYKGFKDKKKYITKQTSFLTGISLYAISFTYFSLKLIFSGIITTISAILWTIIFIQSVIYKK